MLSEGFGQGVRRAVAVPVIALFAASCTPSMIKPTNASDNLKSPAKSSPATPQRPNPSSKSQGPDPTTFDPDFTFCDEIPAGMGEQMAETLFTDSAVEKRITQVCGETHEAMVSGAMVQRRSIIGNRMCVELAPSIEVDCLDPKVSVQFK